MKLHLSRERPRNSKASKLGGPRTRDRALREGAFCPQVATG